MTKQKINFTKVGGGERRKRVRKGGRETKSPTFKKNHVLVTLGIKNVIRFFLENEEIKN